MEKIKKIKNKMPDVFYAMKRGVDDNDDTPLRQRKPTAEAVPDVRSPSQVKPEEYYSTDSDTDAATERPPPVQRQAKSVQLTPSQKFWKRFWSTWTMIFGFFFIIYMGHTTLCLFIITFQALAFREIVSLGSNAKFDAKLTGSHLLHWYFFVSSLFFLYGKLLTEHLLIGMFEHKNPVSQFLLRHHDFISFMLVCIGVIYFVLSLKKGCYKYQFKQLGWCLAVIIIVVVQSTFVMNNIMDGIIWFFIPASAIVTNDIMAYMCGRYFGKKFISTPLINLSPNKTWEGAIGACFWTVLIEWQFAKYLMQYQLFICPKKGFDLTYPTCEPDAVFISQPYHVPYLNTTMELAPFQIHAIAFALWASLIGPFGGFFASGFKRAFKLKDFSQSVGFGHGGVIDRMDCQIMMCVFVYVYRLSFVVNSSAIVGVHEITRNILKLSKDDQIKLLHMLQKVIEKQ